MESLVSTEWLAEEIGSCDLRIVDASSHLPIAGRNAREEYEAGHIPGAINIYYDPGADPAGRQLLLSALPVEKQLVPYCE